MQFQAVCETLLRKVTDMSAGPRSCSFETPLHSVLFKWAGERQGTMANVLTCSVRTGGLNRLLQIQTIYSERIEQRRRVKLTSLFWNHTGWRQAQINATLNTVLFSSQATVRTVHLTGNQREKASLFVLRWRDTDEGSSASIPVFSLTLTDALDYSDETGVRGSQVVKLSPITKQKHTDRIPIWESPGDTESIPQFITYLTKGHTEVKWRRGHERQHPST